MTFGPEDFRRLSGVPVATLKRLELYAAALGQWQTRINLVSAATLPDLWRRHILDSWQLVPFTDELAPGDWIDLGSGAGFPGLVAALCLPEGWTVHLVESDLRKAVFLRECIRLTGAPAVVHAVRADALDRPPARVVSARALAPLDKLLPMAARFWAPGTTGLFLKGRRVKEELEMISAAWSVTYDVIESRSDSSGRIVRLRSLARAP